MKKIIVTSVLVLVSYFGFSQSMTNISVYYGTTNKFGGDLNLITKKNFIFGFGFGTTLENGGVGEHYTTINFGQFPQDVYQVRRTNGTSIYGNVGYKIKNLLIGTKIGVTSGMVYQNRFDRFKILGNNGYYYTSANSETKAMVGGFASYLIKDKFGPTLGYDTFNGVNFGISFKF
jgi:hypothetical protein